MWIITFALLAACVVISGATDICTKERQEVCFTPQLERVPFPDSIEAIDRICPFVIARLSCLIDYQSRCGTNNTGGVDDALEQINELVSDACDKDSELHNDLSVNLPCMEEVVGSQGNSCQPIIAVVMEAVERRILLRRNDSDSADDGAQDGSKYFCLYEALNFACVMADVSVTCGTGTKELVAGIVNRVGYLDISCDADVRDEIKEMVAVIQLEFEEGIVFKNITFKA